MREMRVIGGKDHRLWPLFANESLRGVAVSWFSLFSSVFVYKQLLDFWQPRWALVGVFLFWAVFGLGKLLGASLAENLSLRWGLKAQVGLGLGLLALAAAFFALASFRSFTLLLAVISWGFSAGVYWFGRHGLVGKLGKLGEYGKAVGSAAFLASLAGFLAPIAGGVLINWGGYQVLFMTALGLIVLALFFLLLIKSQRTHHDATFREILVLFVSHQKTFLTYFSLGALGVITSSTFVLYLALILEKELALGGFFSASLILLAIIKWFIGRLIDLGKQGEFIFLGSILRSLVWVGRMLTANVGLLLGLNVVNGLAVGMVGMPLEVLTLEKGIDGRSMGRAVLFREAAIGLGEMMAGIVLAVLAFLGLPLTVGFVLAVPLSLVPILIYGKNK